MIDSLEKYSLIIIAAGILLEAFLAFFIIRHYVRIKKKTMYSYRNASFLGASIFMVVAVLLTIVRAISNRSSDFQLLNFITGISGIFGVFPVLMLPFMLVFFFFMGISNLSLLRHEGKSLKNILGSLFGFGMLAVTIALFLGWDIVYQKIIFEIYASGYRWISVVDKLIPSYLSSLVCYLECLLLGIIICSIRAAKFRPAFDKDFVIILGCAISKDGKPLPLLRGRIDRAIEFSRAQLQATGKKIKFVPSGGKGDDECISEAESMKEYLLSQGIDESDILTENRSVNTLENMMFSKALIEAEGNGSNVIFSTTNYHVFRSGIYAGIAGMDAQGIGSKTKWYFWPNAFVREYIALLASGVKERAVNAAVLFAICLVSSLISFFLVG